MFYTHKVTYHTVADSKHVENAQLFEGEAAAQRWANIQKCRGFNPVSVDDNVDIDENMEHIGGIVHQGHYIRR